MRALGVCSACLAVGMLVPSATWARPQDRFVGPTSGRAVTVRVRDAATGAPLRDAVLRCAPAVVAASDADGTAVLAGCRGPIEVSAPSYVTTEIETPAVAVVDVQLSRQQALTDSVTVVGPAAGGVEPAVPAQVAVTRDELAMLRSVTFDDPLRTLQQLPGVGTSDELRAELSVRGSPFRQVGLVVDEVKSRLLVHTVRGVEQTGSVALLNADLIEAATLTPGSGPQRFGNTVGAELAIRTRAGRTAGLHGRLLASAIASTGYLEGPLFSDRVTVIAGVRRSYASWIVRRIDPDVSGTFEFVDTQAKLDARLTARQQVSAGLLAGTSAYDERGRRTNANALDVGRNRTAMGTVAWQWVPGQHWMLRQRVAGLSSRYRNENPDGAPLDAGTEHEWLSRSIVEWAPIPSLTADAAVQVQRFASRGTSLVYDPDTRTADPGVAHRGEQSLSGGHVHARWSPHRATTVAAGGRVDQVSGLPSAVGGWVQGQVALSPALVVSASVSRHTQAPDVLQRFGPAGTPVLRFETARLVDAGLAWRVGAFGVAVNGYHRRENDGLDTPGRLFRIGSDGRVAGGNPRALWTNALDGSARGVEVVVRRQSTAAADGWRWSGWVGYGYGRSTYGGAGDGAFPSAFEQRHLLTVSGSVHLGDAWDASGSVRWATNWPYDGWFRADADGRLRLSAERNALRLPDYGRADVRLRRTMSLPRGRVQLFAEVINVTNARNLRQVSANIDLRTGLVSRLSERQLPIVPALGVAYEF